jgi:catechol 2,3-dioxygenase-like lactoylglutathione lyase family enzyme
MRKTGKEREKEQSAAGQLRFPFHGLARQALWDTVVLSGFGFVQNELEAERTALCGEPYAHQEHRQAVRAVSRPDLAHDAGIATSGRSPTEFTLGHNVGSEREVDTVMRQAIAAGARLVKPALKTFWGGYAGYFQDPDDHLWEVLFNPAFLPED